MAMSQNHYDEKRNKCFVLMWRTGKIQGDLVHTRQLLDAFEGRDLGYLYHNLTDQRAPLDCRVTLPSGKEEVCATEKEFEQLAKAYMQ